MVTFPHFVFSAALAAAIVQPVDLKMPSLDGVQRLEQLWLITYVDSGGVEIVAQAKLTSGAYAPLIAADASRLESIMPVARELAKANQVTLQLIKFTGRVNIEEIKP